jgi:hypothetical protein
MFKLFGLAIYSTIATFVKSAVERNIGGVAMDSVSRMEMTARYGGMKRKNCTRFWLSDTQARELLKGKVSSN